MGAGAGTENKGEAIVRERGGQMVVHKAEEEAVWERVQKRKWMSERRNRPLLGGL